MWTRFHGQRFPMAHCRSAPNCPAQVSEVAGHVAPQLSAYHWAFLTAAAVALLAVGLAFGIDDKAAAPTMRPRVRQPGRERVVKAAAAPITKAVS
ncbi:MAG: hypothetical protein WA731_09900 [Pseudonocardiaceae bacterium]